ncbi:MAG: hypothetical protein ACM31G_02390 [Flavobacteriales bacterium]
MEDVILTESSFEEFDKIKKRRRKLLPWWIKMFCWIFMLFGLMSFICLILGFTNIKPDLAFYGFETNEPFSLNGLIVMSVGILKGFTAFALWFEKDYAIKIGKIDAVIGIALCVISMLVLPFLQEVFRFTLRLELALLIPFLMKLNKIQKEWEALN